MTLPAPMDGKFEILKPGKDTCKITEEPEVDTYGPSKTKGILIRFNATSDEDGSITPASVLLFTFPDKDTGYCPYKILEEEIIKSREEPDWVGKIFKATFEVGPHPKRPNQSQHKIIHIEYEKGEEEPDFPPEPEREPGEDEDDIPF